MFDADIGMANIDVLMGVSSPYNLHHLLQREKRMEEIIQYGPQQLPFIAGGSGMSNMFSLSEEELHYFMTQIETVSDGMDYIIFDTGAGLSKETMKFITSADQCIVVTTPEPTSITDAYALIKVVHVTEPSVPFSLIINRAGDDGEAKEASDKIILTTGAFWSWILSCWARLRMIPMLSNRSNDRFHLSSLIPVVRLPATFSESLFATLPHPLHRRQRFRRESKVSCTVG